MNKTISINGVSIGQDFPPYVIAEMYAGMAKGRIKITLNVFLKGKLKKSGERVRVTLFKEIFKKSINLLTESGFVEEKSYEDYK